MVVVLDADGTPLLVVADFHPPRGGHGVACRALHWHNANLTLPRTCAHIQSKQVMVGWRCRSEDDWSAQQCQWLQLKEMYQKSANVRFGVIHCDGACHHHHHCDEFMNERHVRRQFRPDGIHLKKSFTHSSRVAAASVAEIAAWEMAVAGWSIPHQRHACASCNQPWQQHRGCCTPTSGSRRRCM